MRTASSPRRAVREQRAAYRAGLPGPVYCDTSALLKLYLPEAGSDAFNALVEGRDDLLVSDLCVTEAASALARRVRGGALPRDAARRVQHAILARVDEGAYQRVELTREVHRRAEHLLLSLGDIPLRASDALHLALAASARAASLASFDTRMAAAARAASLVVHDALVVSRR
ncbi:MAG TPA: type II toxin-antitoxin system VapC family toxin [Methylomirabilota bacterium]|nr:type II toxin-antitoxin system VapC family toxin [Methylomirabilota bacterium]